MKSKILPFILLFSHYLFTTSCISSPSSPRSEFVVDPTTPISGVEADTTGINPTSTGPAVCEEILFTFYNIHMNRNGGANIYAFCPGDLYPRWVTTNARNYNRFPSWSPDKSQIAFLSESSGFTQLHIINRDGSNERQITSGSDLDAEGVTLHPDGSLDFLGVIWLPDETRIAVALRGNAGPIWQSVDVDTGETSLLDAWIFQDMSMSLSNDGTRIAYISDTKPDEIESPQEIFIQDIDGSNHFQLTSTDWIIHNPVWSPDDSQIAFLSSSEYGTDYGSDLNAIYTVNLDGSNLHELVLTDLNSWEIAWSPDGNSIAVFSSEIQSTGDIFRPESSVSTLYTLNLRTYKKLVLFRAENPDLIFDLTW
jgi:Tol biopolymer transport system component